MHFHKFYVNCGTALVTYLLTLPEIPCHFHDDVICLLLQPKSLSFFLPYSNLDITSRFKFKKPQFALKVKTLKDPGSRVV